LIFIGQTGRLCQVKGMALWMKGKTLSKSDSGTGIWNKRKSGRQQLHRFFEVVRKKWWLWGKKVDGTGSDSFSMAGIGVIIVG